MHEPHALAGTADVDGAVDQPAERTDRAQELGILVRRELAVVGWVGQLHIAKLIERRHTVGTRTEYCVLDGQRAIEANRHQLAPVRRRMALAGVAYVSHRHRSAHHAGMGDQVGLGVAIMAVADGLPAAVVAHDRSAVLPLDRDRAYHAHGIGIEHAIGLHDLARGAADEDRRSVPWR